MKKSRILYQEHYNRDIRKTAATVYEYIEKFANYGFNRSHAFAYSFVGFQMAYLKAHHPGAFLPA